MTMWNGDPREFEQEYASVFKMATTAKPVIVNKLSSDVTDTKKEIVGATIQFPKVTTRDMEIDARITVALEEERERTAFKRIEDEKLQKQIDQEFEQAGTVMCTFNQVVESLDNNTDIATITTSTSHSDGDGWIVYNASTGAVTYPEGMEEEIEEDDDYITVSEFKDFIYDLIEEKAGALPDHNDWVRIKNMLDQMPEDYPEDYDDDEGYYGSNEDSILVGEADESTNLNYDGKERTRTTLNGVEIKNWDAWKFIVLEQEGQDNER